MVPLLGLARTSSRSTASKIAFEDGKLIYKGHAEPLFKLHPDEHGWERFGQDHSGLLANGQPTKPYMEGAWMTKVGGRYYLQYGAPGTEFNAYANGTYVSDKPLGPFKYAPYNPIAYKPGGFVHGAGHGSTFQDRYGNWWNTGTPWIGYNWTFERRIDMFPAKFYADGQMSGLVALRAISRTTCRRRRSTTPTACSPAGCCCRTASRRAPRRPWASLAPRRVTDENPQTFWVAAANKPGETLTVDLGRVDTVRAVQVNFADYKSGRFADAPDIYTEFTLQASPTDSIGSDVARTEPPRRDRPNAYFELAQPVRARFIRYVHGHVGAANLAISDLRVFGNADGRAPATPAAARGKRHADQRDATIRWAQGAGRGRLQHPLRHPARPADADPPAVGRRARQRRDADEGAALAERRRALLGRGRSLQRNRRVEAQPRSPDPLASQPPVKPARSSPRRIAGTRRMYRHTKSSR